MLGFSNSSVYHFYCLFSISSFWTLCFFFSPSSFFVDFSVDFSLLFNVLGSSSFSKQGFQFFASKFSIFSSGFLCVWSSDIRFFIKTVHNSTLFSYYYLKPGNQLYFCFLESVTFNQGFLTLPAATTFVVNALLHKLLSDPYLSKYNLDLLEYQCQHTDTIYIYMSHD